MTIIEATEQNDSKKATLEAELKFLTDCFIEAKRTSASRDTELSSRLNAYDEVLKTTKAHFEEVKFSIEDVLETIGKTKSASGVQLQSSQQQCAYLEKDLEQKRTEWTEERRRLENALNEERRDAEESKSKYESWRKEHSLALENVSQEVKSRIEELEETRTKKEELFKNEETKLKGQLEANHGKIESLKAEASRLRHAVQGANASFGQVRAEVERSERELNYAHSQYYEELKGLANGVEEAKRNEGVLAKVYLN